eukprot:Nk52_evm24s210 gene=Nk52_evmTU24s210
MYYIGVDVGTGSVRAAVLDAQGRLLSKACKDIATRSYGGGLFYEQSSMDIWARTCECVRECMEVLGIGKSCIQGICFDATCSLVVLGGGGRGCEVSKGGLEEEEVCQNGDLVWDVVLWLDHRAIAEAEYLTKLDFDGLKYIGGVMSPEMEIPKLMWLLKNKGKEWMKSVDYVMDLCDFLTFKATSNSDIRSSCSLTCKWTFLPPDRYESFLTSAGSYREKRTVPEGWDRQMLASVGLTEEVMGEGLCKMGTKVLDPGDPIPGGLSEEAAILLGLVPGTAVGVGIIDAHAGSLGVIGSVLKEEKEDDEAHHGESIEFRSRMAMISGTSTCHMGYSPRPVFVDGVWGPYFSVAIPGMWLNEAGQSVAGKALDAAVCGHFAFETLFGKNPDMGYVYRELDKYIQSSKFCKVPGECYYGARCESLHVIPDFHGNRSPWARSDMKGIMCGLTLSHMYEPDYSTSGKQDSCMQNLCEVYLASVQGLAYGTKHIIDELNAKGYCISDIIISGGLSNNELYLREHCFATQCDVYVPREQDSVLVGCGMLAAVAAGSFSDVPQAMKKMGGARLFAKSADITLEQRLFHEKKYKSYQILQKCGADLSASSS